MNLRPRPASRFLRPDLLPGNATMRVVLVLSITAIVALATVVNMMQGDYTNLVIGFCIAGIALYVGGLWKQSWAPAVMIGIAGFSIAPTSFWIPADFMVCGMAVVLGVTVLMRRALGASAMPRTHVPGVKLSAIVAILTTYALYLIFQGMAGEVAPVYTSEYALRNTIKAYMEDFAPVLTLLVLIAVRHRMPPIESLVKWVSPAIGFSLLLLIIYRAYQISKGHYESDELTAYFGILIPVINLIPGEFALRVASPIAALWAASLLFSPTAKLSRVGILINVGLLALAFMGAVLSSGRAVPVLVLFAAGGMAFVFRRFGFIFVSVAAGVLFVVAVNVAGSTIDRLPYAIRRSVAMLRFEQSNDRDSISGSTTMRDFLIDEGKKEVLGNNRVLLFGRGVLKFTLNDARINEGDMEYEKWMLAVRTGRLHRTSANQVIRYGLVGAGLYYLGQLAILLYVRKVFKMFRGQRAPEASLAAFALGLMVMNTVIGLVQDAPFTSLTAWFVALVVGVVAKAGAPVAALQTAPLPVTDRQMPMATGLAGRRG